MSACYLCIVFKSKYEWGLTWTSYTVWVYTIDTSNEYLKWLWCCEGIFRNGNGSYLWMYQAWWPVAGLKRGIKPFFPVNCGFVIHEPANFSFPKNLVDTFACGKCSKVVSNPIMPPHAPITLNSEQLVALLLYFQWNYHKLV